jgi:hypothetical protein
LRTRPTNPSASAATSGLEDVQSALVEVSKRLTEIAASTDDHEIDGRTSRALGAAGRVIHGNLALFESAIQSLFGTVPDWLSLTPDYIEYCGDSSRHCVAWDTYAWFLVEEVQRTSAHVVIEPFAGGVRPGVVESLFTHLQYEGFSIDYLQTTAPWRSMARAAADVFRYLANELAKGSSTRADVVAASKTHLTSREIAGESERSSHPESITYNEDFTSVNWGNVQFSFAPGQQSAIVKRLVAARDSGHPDVSISILQEVVETGHDNWRIGHVFRRNGRPHPAWKHMIVSVKRARYRIADPPKTADPTQIPPTTPR